MSDMSFRDPSPDHQEFMEEASQFAHQMAGELIAGYAFDGSELDLRMIQSIVDSGMLDTAADPPFLFRCLGFMLGNVFVTSRPELSWQTITDEGGEDLGLRYGVTTIVLWPVSMLSKRAEEGREIDAVHMHTWLLQQIDGMVASGDFE